MISLGDAFLAALGALLGGLLLVVLPLLGAWRHLRRGGCTRGDLHLLLVADGLVVAALLAPAAGLGKALGLEWTLPGANLLAALLLWGGALGLAAARRSGAATPERRLRNLLLGLPLLPALIFVGLCLLVVVGGLSAAIFARSDASLPLMSVAVALGFPLGLFALPCYGGFRETLQAGPPPAPGPESPTLDEYLRRLFALGGLLTAWALLLHWSDPLLAALLFGLPLTYFFVRAQLRRSRYTLLELLLVVLVTGQAMAGLGALLPRALPVARVIGWAVLAGALVLAAGARGIRLARALPLEARRPRLGRILLVLLLPAVLGLGGWAVAEVERSARLPVGPGGPRVLLICLAWIAAAAWLALYLSLELCRRDDAPPREPPAPPAPPDESGPAGEVDEVDEVDQVDQVDQVD